MENKNDFYVYEWFNIDTNEVFYVGKGRGKRYKEVKRRNQLFLKYYKEHNVNVRKIKENLSEEEAFSLEKITVDKYKKQNQCQCNLAEEAGTGGCSFIWTDEMKKYWSTYNPMKRKEQRERMSKNNPMKNLNSAKKTGEAHKRAVVINGIKYPGCIDAAKTLNVCSYTISTWCKRGYDTFGNPCHYADELQKEYTVLKKGKAVIIDNKDYYETVPIAAKALGAKDPSGLYKALKNNKPYKGHICRYVNQQPS